MSSSYRIKPVLSFGPFDSLHLRFRRPYLRDAPAGFGLERLTPAFMSIPAYTNYMKQATCLI
jgi:hypothetical protein